MEPASKANGDEPELDLGLELEKNTETMPAPEVELKTKPTERAIAVDNLPLAQSPAELSPEKLPLPALCETEPQPEEIVVTT